MMTRMGREGRLLSRAIVTWVATLGLAGSASAATITGLSITDSSTLTTPGDTGGIKGSAIVASAAMSFTTRYYTTVAADRGAGASGSRTATTSVNYTISFSVTHASGVPYQVDVANAIAGALSELDDALGAAGNGSASVTNVTGSKTGGGALAGSLGLSSTAPVTGTSSTSVVNTAVSKSGAATIFAVGTGAPQAYTLTFSWTASATSPGPGLFSAGGDEEAARFGLSTASGSVLGSATADDYASGGLLDGQTVTVTVTPEPQAFALLGVGLTGLALLGRRKAA